MVTKTPLIGSKEEINNQEILKNKIDKIEITIVKRILIQFFKSHGLTKLASVESLKSIFNYF